jgi:soluble lytic murein transglycosylase-like protein
VTAVTSADDAPTTEETEAAAPTGSVTEIIYAAAAAHGLDGAYLVSVAECESGLDPGAVNSAGYYGLFQFDEQTWAAYGSGPIFDPAAQAEAAASLIAGGQASRWPNCA